MFAVVIATAATTALVASPAAFGTADPVASGTLSLKLSKGFKKQLKKNHVSMKPKKFTISGGTLDPTTGAGTVNLSGKLTFKNKKGGKKVVYKKLTATLGSGGVLKGKGGKVFKVKGGSVARNGFGANVTGMKLSFLKGAAKKINKKLGLHSLHKGSAGTASANNVQPSAVTLVGGTTELTPNLGTLAKFADHCVNAATGGVAPIAPATVNPATAPPSFDFPITGGSIGPTGASGAVNHGGGIQITKNDTTTGACGAFPNNGAQVTQDQLTVDLSTKQVQAHVVITGAASATLNGDKGSTFIATLDTSGATVTADPATRKITVTNATAAFNATAALVLNGVFLCNSGNSMTTGCNGSSAFVAGDPLGTLSISGQTQ